VNPAPSGTILLTLDPARPARVGATHAIVVGERLAARQAREVLRALQLESRLGQRGRCARCGAALAEPRCTDCGRIVRGSSLARLFSIAGRSKARREGTLVRE
jgi:uncharacterized protein with PIN domain